MAEKHFISNKNESVRMFKTDFIEASSKTHWSLPIWIFAPIIGYLFYLTFSSTISIGQTFLLCVSGIFVWTFVEYVMHRFVFHYVPKSQFGKKLHWIMHGVHHDYPQDDKRLVLPPGLSLPLATSFFLLFYSFIPMPELFPFFASFLIGYLIYDIGHYAMHHFSFKSNLFKKIKLHHMKHHYVEPHEGYGVSSPLWDIIFRTKESNK
jgi:4-hydroxysphinganine ceramide fatty acyl 2-hydroxylase